MRSTRLAFTGVIAAALAAVLGPATPALASNDCAPRTTTQAFAQFGDTNEYFPISGGTFETGDLSQFQLAGGHAIVEENEPWRVLGAGHNRALALPPGATMKATFCVQIGEDSMRLFVKSPGASSSLTVKATVSTAYGSASAGFSTTGGTAGWSPSARLPLKNVSGPDGKQYVTLTVTNTGKGTWLFDDILVDPWKTR